MHNLWRMLNEKIIYVKLIKVKYLTLSVLFSDLNHLSKRTRQTLIRVCQERLRQKSFNLNTNFPELINAPQMI